MTQHKKFIFSDAMKRVEELKQETIMESKKIPNSDEIVKARLEELSHFKTSQSQKRNQN